LNSGKAAGGGKQKSSAKTSGPAVRGQLRDLAWALINSAEFIHRH